MAESNPPHRTRRHRTALLLGGVTVLALVFALGPRVRFEERWVEPELPAETSELDRWLAERESRVPELRPGDRAEVVWADPSAPARTPLSLVYLHGFSADRHEIEPVVTELAEALGANTFFARLRGHGRDGPAMAEAEVEDWLDDTAEAIAIGRRIGERVLLVGTSTGGTLATWAAARPETDASLAGLVLVSPNFQPKDRSSRILLLPWGVRLARLVVGDERCFTPENDEQERHWTTCYPTPVLGTMMALVEHVRTMDLTGVDVPTLVLFSPADRVVEPEVTREVMEGVRGVEPVFREIRSTSDPAHHVLAGDIVSSASNREVREAILAFVDGLGTGPPAAAGGAEP